MNILIYILRENLQLHLLIIEQYNVELSLNIKETSEVSLTKTTTTYFSNLTFSIQNSGIIFK